MDPEDFEERWRTVDYQELDASEKRAIEILALTLGAEVTEMFSEDILRHFLERACRFIADEKSLPLDTEGTDKEEG